MSGTETLVDLGGPVFPQETHNADGSTSVWFGMNVRDLFAAAALQGMLAASWGNPMDSKRLANDSYRVADAMLAARERKEESK